MLVNFIQNKRQIKKAEGERKAKELRADFGETSAKTGCNVKDVSSITYTQLFFGIEETCMLYCSVKPKYTVNINSRPTLTHNRY